ncbi:FecR family protein [Bacteroides xylanisolvens]|jgi:transmembrane sensor|uniref:FecR family protein n=1 Tax=Bacteroides TaxID=816 RepID=UPI001F28C282|nr:MULTISPECIES: FecR family protein [Bacteroides]MCF2548782.1 FecR family protein [Bacteroides xylanisolvens]
MDAKLLNKYIVGDALPEEKKEVIRWMKESEENREQLMQLHRVYNATIWNGNLQAEKTENKKPVMRYLWASIKIAAVVAMVAFIIHKEYQEYRIEHSAEMQIMTVPAGQRASLVLADGTIVWLNSNSTLKYPATGFHSKERKVILEGEGYFEVAHNEKHPFIVETEKYDIRVLGTTFNVSAYPNSGLFETSLIEGKVTVYQPDTQHEMTLKPHEKVEVKDGKLYKETFSSDNDFLWRMGIYSFKDEPLETVFRKLEQYYEVKIINKNEEIASRPCTGKFRQKEGIEHVMKVLQKYVKFNYIQDDEKNQIIIY